MVMVLIKFQHKIRMIGTLEIDRLEAIIEHFKRGISELQSLNDHRFAIKHRRDKEIGTLIHGSIVQLMLDVHLLLLSAIAMISHNLPSDQDQQEDQLIEEVQETLVHQVQEFSEEMI